MLGQLPPPDICSISRYISISKTGVITGILTTGLTNSLPLHPHKQSKKKLVSRVFIFLKLLKKVVYRDVDLHNSATTS